MPNLLIVCNVQYFNRLELFIEIGAAEDKNLPIDLCRGVTAPGLLQALFLCYPVISRNLVAMHSVTDIAPIIATCDVEELVFEVCHLAFTDDLIEACQFVDAQLAIAYQARVLGNLGVMPRDSEQVMMHLDGAVHLEVEHHVFYLIVCFRFRMYLYKGASI